jgi:hypothetical protein
LKKIPQNLEALPRKLLSASGANAYQKAKYLLAESEVSGKESLIDSYLVYDNPMAVPGYMTGIEPAARSDIEGQSYEGDVPLPVDAPAYYIHNAASFNTTNEMMTYIRACMVERSWPQLRMFYLTLLKNTVSNLHRRLQLVDEIMENSTSTEEMKQWTVSYIMDWTILYASQHAGEVYERYESLADSDSLPFICYQVLAGYLTEANLMTALKTIGKDLDADQTPKYQLQAGIITTVLEALVEGHEDDPDVRFFAGMLDVYGLSMLQSQQCAKASTKHCWFLVAQKLSRQSNGLAWHVLAGILYEPSYYSETSLYPILKATSDFNHPYTRHAAQVGALFWAEKKTDIIESVSRLCSSAQKYDDDPMSQDVFHRQVADQAEALVQRGIGKARIDEILLEIIRTAKDAGDISFANQILLAVLKEGGKYAPKPALVAEVPALTRNTGLIIDCFNYLLGANKTNLSAKFATKMTSEADEWRSVFGHALLVHALARNGQFEELLDAAKGKAAVRKNAKKLEDNWLVGFCQEAWEFADPLLADYKKKVAKVSWPKHYSRNIDELTAVPVDQLSVLSLLFLSSYLNECLDPVSGISYPVGGLLKPIMPDSVLVDVVDELLKRRVAAISSHYQGRDLSLLKLEIAVEPIGEPLVQAAAVESQLEKVFDENPHAIEKAVRLIFREELSEFIKQMFAEYRLSDSATPQQLKPAVDMVLSYLPIDKAEKASVSAVIRFCANARRDGYDELKPAHALSLVKNYARAAARDGWDFARVRLPEDTIFPSYVREYICSKGWDNALRESNADA